MAYQFIHLETYSRKSDKSGRSTSFIFDEAERQKHASLHVENSAPPHIVFGQSISSLRDEHDHACSTFKMINSKGQERSIRVDQNTLLTVIASHPFAPQECLSDVSKMSEYEEWEKETVNWLKSQYGPALKTVIRHMDEGHMHIHAYVLPDDLKAFDIHPGVSAKRKEKSKALDAGEDGKTANKIGDKAYKESMRAWQDSYYNSVAIRHGLARLGPRLRRLQRGEWQREKVQAEALKQSLKRAEKVKEQAAIFVEKTKEKASLIIDVSKEKFALADIKLQAAEKASSSSDKRLQKASKTLKEAHREAKAILDEIDIKARKTSSLGGFLRNFFDGFRKSKIKEEISKKYEDRLIDMETEKRVSDNRYFDMKSERDKFKNQSTNLRSALTSVTNEKNKLSDLIAHKKSSDGEARLEIGRKPKL